MCQSGYAPDVTSTRTIEQHSHPRYPRLTILRRNTSRFYQARTYLDARLVQTSLKVETLTAAFKLGEDWYRKQLRESVQVGHKHPLKELGVEPTMGEVFRHYRTEVEKKRQAEADKRWSPIADFWRTLLVSEVTSQTFKDFYAWRRRRNASITPHTLHKDISLIRPMLKFAIQEGHLSALPIIPKTGQIAQNPRPWLTRAEWDHLRKVSEQRIESAENPRLQQQRSELDDQMAWMIATMMRVGEMRAIRFRDCRVEKNEERTKILICEVQGKRGARTVVGRRAATAIYTARLKTSAPDALIFPVHHREAFTELLKAAGLHRDPRSGFERNFKSLRATAISFAILRGAPSPNLLMIARNAGTSVAMVDAFYARRLSSEMAKEELTAKWKD